MKLNVLTDYQRRSDLECYYILLIFFIKEKVRRHVQQFRTSSFIDETISYDFSDKILYKTILIHHNNPLYDHYLDLCEKNHFRKKLLMNTI